MKAIRINSPRDLEICQVDDIDNRKLNAGEVWVKTKAAGICGSDFHIYNGTHPIGDYPKIIGHEMVGEVQAVGKGVNRVGPGDHVVLNPMISCNVCYACSIGRPNICSTLQVRGVHVDGGYQEHLVLPESRLHKVDQKLDWTTAVLIEPYTIAAQVIWRSRITAQDNVLITGAGPIGLAVLEMAKLEGANCTITDLFDEHLEIAHQIGADYTINSSRENVEDAIKQRSAHTNISVIIEAVGLTSLLEQAVRIAAPAARIVVLGFEQKPIIVSQFDFAFKELEIIGSRLNTQKFPEVIDAFNSGNVRPKPLITHTFHFTEAQQAFHLLEKQPEKVCKIVLLFD